jgi:hypothetical protein
MNPIISFIAIAAIIFALSVIVFILTGLRKNGPGQ